MNMKHGLRAAALAAVVLVGSMGCDRGGAAGAGPGGPGGAPPTPEVVTHIVRPERLVLTSELPGRASAFQVAEIRPQVSGIIQKRLFAEGADVKAGDALYQIDPAPFQAAYDSAIASVESSRKAIERAKAAVGASAANVVRQQATLKLARTNAQRFEDLFREKAVPESQRDQAATDVEVAAAAVKAAEAQVESDKAAVAAAEAALKQAEAAVQIAKISLGYTRIVAPIAGRIGRSNVTEGATVTAYQAQWLASIQKFDPMYIDVPQSTMELMRLRRASPGAGDQSRQVRLILQDGSVYKHAGTLEFRDVTVDPTTGSVTLRIVAPNPDGHLLPGMFVRAAVEEGVVEEAMLVPQQGITRDPRGNPVTLVLGADGKVEQRQIKTERAVGDKWLVTSGLKAGDRVIIEGLQKVRAGMNARAATQPATSPATKQVQMQK
jgi:membrane fusion protein (multidrug efflux system)